jgi:hypothetical protein
LLVEPPTVRQAADEGEVWSPTALAPTTGALEANVAAQLTPMRRIAQSRVLAAAQTRAQAAASSLRIAYGVQLGVAARNRNVADAQ